MGNERKRGGWTNPAAAANGKAGGRPATSVTLRTGDGVMMAHVYPDGAEDLGRGTVTIESVGRSRIVRIAQADGSEIRILIPR